MRKNLIEKMQKWNRVVTISQRSRKDRANHNWGTRGEPPTDGNNNDNNNNRENFGTVF